MKYNGQELSLAGQGVKKLLKDEWMSDKEILTAVDVVGDVWAALALMGERYIVTAADLLKVKEKLLCLMEARGLSFGWTELPHHNRLVILSNSSTVEYNLLREDKKLLKMLQDNATQEACMTYINESF